MIKLFIFTKRDSQFCCLLIDPASPHARVAWTVRCVESNEQGESHCGEGVLLDLVRLRFVMRERSE
jgi:hypothetical protein